MRVGMSLVFNTFFSFSSTARFYGVETPSNKPKLVASRVKDTNALSCIILTPFREGPKPLALRNFSIVSASFSNV